MNKKILNLIEKRLLVGERKYGNENVTNDGRDFVKEALEESLDLAVYVSAKLIEIEKKEKQMGRAIDHENEIYKLKIEMKELQDVVAELSEALMSTKQVHHVDLHDDEEFTPPADKRTKTTKRKTVTVD